VSLSLFNELKRRNVIKVVAGYLVFAWIVMQVADVVLNNFDAPAWVFKVLTLMLALGLPSAVFFSWAFEFTPDGVRREEQVEQGVPGSARLIRKLLFAAVCALSFVVFFFAADRIVEEHESVAEVTSTAARDIPARSIAVLPFRNRSALEDDVYFVDGIHDDILTQLAGISVFDKVISRTSVEQYRDTARPIPDIGRELGVATILEGGIQRAGSRIRINMQLIDAMSDEHVWAQTYDRELTVENIFAIQSEISREVVGALRAVLTEQDETRLQMVPTRNLEAYDQYVLGRHQLAKRTAESAARAIEHFEKAVELDPDYALAYVGLADATTIYAFQSGREESETFSARQASIDKALELDPMSGEAYTSLAMLRAEQGKPEDAKKYYRKAIELNPNYATAYQWYSFTFNTEGQHEKALKYISKAVELDPMAPILRVNMIDTLQHLGRHEEAMQEIRDGLERHPEFPIFYNYLSRAVEAEGDLARSLRLTQTAMTMTSSNPRYGLRECGLFLELGFDDRAESCFIALEKKFPGVAPGVVGQVYRFRGDYDRALGVAKQAAQSDPSDFLLSNLAWNYLDQGMIEEARAIAEDLQPDFFADRQVTVEFPELFDAMMAAYILWTEDDRDRADYLFEQMLALMKAADRKYDGYGAIDVAVHVIRGDREKATTTLGEAINEGWRTSWWLLRLPYFHQMRDDPEWNRLMDELEADIARQRGWYEQNRDKPPI